MVRAEMMAASEWRQEGEALKRMLPFMKKGSWGMALNSERTVWRGMVATSMPSTIIELSNWISSMRNKIMKRELFPLPLRPQIPIFSPGAMCKLTSLRTGFRLECMQQRNAWFGFRILMASCLELFGSRCRDFRMVSQRMSSIEKYHQCSSLDQSIVSLSTRVTARNP